MPSKTRLEERSEALKIQSTNFTIGEILAMLERRDLSVDHTYQRSPKVWPSEARSFFIDTILEEFPFPKIYFLEQFDTARKHILRNIVDGQQRITAIRDFRENRYALTASSKRFAHKTFHDLDEEIKDTFLYTSIQVDLIKSASRRDILEMFRRMNAYTAPLNSAEKRHAAFQGAFKLFVLEELSDWAGLLEEFAILTQKQFVRMADAEFIAELALVLEQGIVNKSESSLRALYERNDPDYPRLDEARDRFEEFFQMLSGSFSPLRGTFIMKPYVLHSLFCAMIGKKFGFPGSEDLAIPVTGTYFTDLPRTLENLTALADAHETQDFEGPLSNYVVACTSTTHRIAQRSTRTRFLANALV